MIVGKSPSYAHVAADLRHYRSQRVISILLIIVMIHSHLHRGKLLSSIRETQVSVMTHCGTVKIELGLFKALRWRGVLEVRGSGFGVEGNS